MSNPQAHPGRKAKAASRAKTVGEKSAVRNAGREAGTVEITPHAGLTAAERHQRIAEAAYYRALQRGFHGGADLEDWLEAEAEIDKLIFHG